jgi:tetratricopeptide (TPR) repeat protein
MSKCFLSARGAVALLAAGLLVGPALPKPPDLPVQYEDSFTPNAPASPSTTPDKPCPDAATAPIQGDTSEEVMRLLTARRMFRIGERCLSKSQFDMAYNCFQEVHLLSPTSRYGQLAIDRLSEIDKRRLSAAGNAKQPKPTSQQGKDNTANRLESARQLYQIGERCRKSGDLDMALNCYREVRQLAPGSALARRAEQHLGEIEKQRTSDEPAEPADEEDSSPDDSQDNSTGGSEAQSSTPRLEILEEHSSPRDNISAPTLRLPLYVNPPARRLLIEQVYPPSEE